MEALDRRFEGEARVPLRAQVDLSAYNLASKIQSTGINLSAGGLSVFSAKSPPVGTRVACRFGNDEEGVSVQAEAEVVWVSPRKTGVTCGLRFTNLEQAKDGLREWLIEQQPSAVGAESPGVVRATDVQNLRRHASYIIAEHSLSHICLGKDVVVREDGVTAKGELQAVELRVVNDVPRLVLTLEEQHLPPDDLAEEDSQVRRAHNARKAARADETWREIQNDRSPAHPPAHHEPKEVTPVEVGALSWQDIAEAPTPHTFRSAGGGGGSYSQLLLTHTPASASAVAKREDDTQPEKKLSHLEDHAAESRSFRPASIAEEDFFDTRGDLPEHAGPAEETDEVEIPSVPVWPELRGRLTTRAALFWRWCVATTSSVTSSLRHHRTRLVPKMRQALTPLNVFWRRFFYFVRALVSPSSGRSFQRPTSASGRRDAVRVQRRPGEQRQEQRRLLRRKLMLVAAAMVVAFVVYRLLRGGADAPPTDAELERLEQESVPAATGMPTEAMPADSAAESEREGALAELPDESDYYGAAAAPGEGALPDPSYEAGQIPHTEYPRASEFTDVPAAPPRGAVEPTKRPETSSSTGKAPFFGSASVPQGRSFLIRMSQPVERIIGKADDSGFEVTVPGSLALDRAGPIAAAHSSVSKSMIVNRGDRAELTMRFAPGRTPTFRVVGRGSAIEIIVGR